MTYDSRTYIRLHDGMTNHPKLAVVGGDAGWLHVCAMSYCSQNLTDGHLPGAVLPRLSDRKKPAALAQVLVSVGMWHTSGHDCQRCPLVAPSDYYVHDYLEHQRSRTEIETSRQQSRSAGQAGGLARAKRVACDSLKRNPSESPSGIQAVSVSVSKKEPPPLRDDVEQLCQHLAKLISENGSRVQVSGAWRDAARKILDVDKRPFIEVIRLIEWSQQDDFWHKNILSMPTFRKQYDKLRLKAKEPAKSSSRVGPGGVILSDDPDADAAWL